MRFLSKPTDYDITAEQEFKDFNWFRLALTHRNWTGNIYATRKDGKHFMKELQELDANIHKLTEEITPKMNLDILIDVSVFAEDVPEQIQLLEFLEDIEDFYSLEETDEERLKTSRKYRKKLMNYTKQLELFPYLYRWYFMNQQHAFSKTLKKELDNVLITAGKQLDKTVQKHNDDVFETVMKYELKNRLRSVHAKLSVNKTESFSPRDMSYHSKGIMAAEGNGMSMMHTQKIANKLLAYSLGEPSLFLYAIYALNTFFEGHSYYLGNSRRFMLISKNNKKLNVNIIYSTPQISRQLLMNEFIYKEIMKGEFTNTQTLYNSIAHIGVAAKAMEVELDRLNLLQSIAEWAASRIDFNKVQSLFKKNITWCHDLPKTFESMLGIRTISLYDLEIVQGPNGTESYIKGLAYSLDGSAYRFPIFDSLYWEDLNSFQCGIIAYSICLLHDMTTEDAVYMVENPLYEKQNLKDTIWWEITKDKPGLFKFKQEFTPEMDMILKRLNGDKESQATTVLDIHQKRKYTHIVQLKQDSFVTAPLAATTKTATQTEKLKGNENEKDSKEHWVSFHFRKLRPNQKSTKEAKGKAQKYGINKIPDGFTFVDSFVRGDKTHDMSLNQISAIQVLGKSVKRLNAYEEKNAETN